MVENLGVEKRHLVRPIGEVLRHPGLEARNETYEFEAKKRIPAVVDQALCNAGVKRQEIDAVVMVSCTGFLMPALTAWMIGELGFRPDVTQIPIAQLGCAAGSSALNRAFDYCRALPFANVLIVSCEFCSLIYQPNDLDIGNLVSNALFGDAVAGAVVRGKGGRGISLLARRSHLVPGTEKWIAYLVKETGFHFLLNKGVPEVLRDVVPVCKAFAASHDFDISAFDYYVFHTGGPKILNAFRDCGPVPQDRLEYSRATLREYGNVASASIFDVARRIFESDQVHPDASFLIAGFGPGITAEFTIGRWT
ncbi:type III polyketide synthase [Rhizobium leguminosarum]|uniref:type III polyketide synthase n=1 Tax=Rhizobium leguminosarum TaxID=384 RepID=UPI001C962CCD|nr:type III polyketide synthase [Rhizobium leguminosarum]